MLRSLLDPYLVLDNRVNVLTNKFKSINVDIRERKDDFVIHADLPGINREDIILEFKDGLLTISAENKKSFEQKEDEKFLKMERVYQKQSRSFVFETPINEESIVAKYENGVLELTLPKKEKQEQVRKITIN